MLEKEKILLIDGDIETQVLITETLCGDNYQVQTAATGEAAFSSIFANPPDLVLLDLLLQDMDGFEVCLRLKEDIRSRDIPVFFLASAASTSERIKGFKVGAVDFITKPFQPDELLARVRTHLELSRLRADLEIQVTRRTDQLVKVNEKLKVELAERKQVESRLLQEQQNFLKVFSAAPVGLLLLDVDTMITHANHSIGEIVFRDPVDIIGKRGGGGLGCIHSLDDPRGCGFGNECPGCPLRTGVEAVLSHGISIHGAEINATMLIDGLPQNRWLRVSSEPVVLEGSRYAIVSVDDITDYKTSEEKQHRSEEKFEKAFRTSPDSININRLSDGLYIDINEGFKSLTGYTEQEVIGKTSLSINIWDNPQDRERLIKGLRETGEVSNLEANFRIKNGQLKTCLMSARILEIHGEQCILSITRDITDRKQAEKQIHAALTEKETLLRELYHRTKNNMQVMSALISLQEDYITDPDLLMSLKEIRSRILAMAMVHQKLYQSRNLSYIDLGDYLYDLSDLVFRSYQKPGVQIELIQD